MNKTQHTGLTLTSYLLLAAVLCYAPATWTAEPAAGDTPITRNTADAILKELSEIRKVLERIEKQGNRAVAQRPAKPTIAKVSIKGKQVMGEADAPVTVVEFADYQCPFCLRFTKTTFPTLKEKYIDTGKVRWAALNLPLPFHKDARSAAQAAHCAGEQDRFWEMRDLLFNNPKKLDKEHLPTHAETLSLDVKAFTTCLQSNRHLAEIDQDAKDVNAVRLTGTPSFIIGKTASDEIIGQVLIGAQPLSAFDSVIGKALEKESAEIKTPEQKARAGEKPAG